MATTESIKPVFSVCATKSDKVKSLPIKNGQLIFVQDNGRIAFDYNDKRKFYNSITTLNSESERVAYSAENDQYFFVIETAVLWLFHDKWIQLTTSPDEVIFIGTSLPSLGVSRKLYIDKQAKEISIWDDQYSKYVVVSDRTESISADEITNLFT